MSTFTISIAQKTDDSSGGAASAEPSNSLVIRENRGQRKSRKIKIVNFACNDNNDGKQPDMDSAAAVAVASPIGLLPSSSRETTPLNDEEAVDDTDENKAFFSGNPFVEVTHGIIHMYKKK